MGKSRGKTETRSRSDATFSVRVKPGTSRNKVTRGDSTTLTVYLTARAVEGEANRALINLLASWLKVPPSSVKVVRGATSRTKMITVAELPDGLIEALLEQEDASHHISTDPSE
jgi:uncharacterized protein